MAKVRFYITGENQHFIKCWKEIRANIGQSNGIVSRILKFKDSYKKSQEENQK